MTYETWKTARIESSPDRMGGAFVFKGSRLTVEHAGGVGMKGREAVFALLLDYPYITAEDVEYAQRWVLESAPRSSE